MIRVQALLGRIKGSEGVVSINLIWKKEMMMARAQLDFSRPFSQVIRVVTSLSLVLLLWSCDSSTSADLLQGDVSKPSAIADVDPNRIWVNTGSFDVTAGGRGFRWSPSVSNVPAVVGGRVLSTASQEQDVALEQLQILSGREQQWRDSCLGIFAPNELCSQVITPGWLAIVTDGSQHWVYHSDAAGETVRFNARASATGLAIAPSVLAGLGQLDGSVLSAYGVMADDYDSMEITAVLVTGEVLILNGKGQIKRSYSVGDAILQAFDQQRNQLSLGAFDGLRYGDGATFSNVTESTRMDPMSKLWVPAVTLLDPQAAVQYHLDSTQSLPGELRDFDAAWRSLICLDPMASCEN